ncbi:hypothetical protein [Nocardioides sp. SYSU D00038]|uniref:hypothetical protein n=1 Tax=Nocardioides sp. SYSU D00038 TaxID=2812554 RepID=UPI001967FBBF|nr:hypothetical protein [Nocardioides sp. SYSU D00038]
MIGQALAVVAVLAVAGAACGRLWSSLWDAPTGVVSDGRWFTDEAGLRSDFSGVGLFVVIGLGAGLLLGALLAWLCDRAELVTLGAVLVGASLAAWLMARVGTLGGPADPRVLAESATDGTRLPARLALPDVPDRLAWSDLPPYTAFPLGALVGLTAVYLLTERRRRRSAR